MLLVEIKRKKKVNFLSEVILTYCYSLQEVIEITTVEWVYSFQMEEVELRCRF